MAMRKLKMAIWTRLPCGRDVNTKGGLVISWGARWACRGQRHQKHFQKGSFWFHEAKPPGKITKRGLAQVPIQMIAKGGLVEPPPAKP